MIFLGWAPQLSVGDGVNLGSQAFILLCGQCLFLTA